MPDKGGVFKRAGRRSRGQAQAAPIPLKKLSGRRIEAAGTGKDQNIAIGFERRRGVGHAITGGEIGPSGPTARVRIVDGGVAGAAGVGAGGEDGAIGTQDSRANFIRSCVGSATGIPKLLDGAAGAGP